MITTNVGGSTFNTGQGEQYATPNAFKKGKMTLKKSFFKEIIKEEVEKYKNKK